MKQYLSLILFVVVAIIAAPTTSEAYVTTEQTAVQITPTTAMYSITYTFDPSAFDFFLPIHTSRDVSDSDNLTLVYETLVNGKDSTRVGDTAALVFSNLEVANNEYHIPRGKRGNFTLVTFLRTNTNEAEADYALKVKKLPFNESRGEGELMIENRLTASELATYQTGEVELNN